MALSSSATQMASTWRCIQSGTSKPSPAFLHAGFNAGRPAEVNTLMKRMEADGVTIVEQR